MKTKEKAIRRKIAAYCMRRVKESGIKNGYYSKIRRLLVTDLIAEKEYGTN